MYKIRKDSLIIILPVVQLNSKRKMNCNKFTNKQTYTDTECTRDLLGLERE